MYRTAMPPGIFFAQKKPRICGALRLFLNYPIRTRA